MSLSINTPYATTAEGDTYWGTTEPWNSASASEKETALQYGRVYIDTNYSCLVFDEDDAPDEIKIANIEFAAQYLTDPTSLFVVPTTTGFLKRSRVKAGEVETEKEYSESGGVKNDPFPRITGILAPYCSYTPNRVDVNVTR